jgi:hypothetical protein
MSTVAERTRRERAAQGLPEHIEDVDVLDQVAALLAGREHDDGPGFRRPGRRAGHPRATQRDRRDGSARR